MKLHSASRAALAASLERLEEVLGGDGADPTAVGEELFGLAGLLIRERVMRRALADASTEPADRVALARRLLDGKLSEPALQVTDTVIGSRWSNARELVDGVEEVGSVALLIAAERAGDLETVETELFQVGRTVGANAGLEQALSEDERPGATKRALVERLFSGKVNPVTETLVGYAVTHLRGQFAETQIDKLSDTAARLKERSVAHVTSASPLADEQRAVLAEKLQRIFGRPITVHVDVRPDVLGGIHVQVGDEVIDGSSAGRLAALRGRLAS